MTASKRSIKRHFADNESIKKPPYSMTNTESSIMSDYGRSSNPGSMFREHITPQLSQNLKREGSLFRGFATKLCSSLFIKNYKTFTAPCLSSVHSLISTARAPFMPPFVYSMT